jgi:hypothetical protein
MKSLAMAVLLAATGLSLMGCVHQQPLISHAHVGHCLTHWSDTPDNQGLFPVARQELETARREADAALGADLSPEQKAIHIRNVGRALNPDAERLGPGLGYGAIRALEAGVEHLEYAATSDDASANVVSAVADLSEIGDNIVERMRNAAARAKSADVRDAATLDQAALELRGTLRAIAVGVDANGDGRIDAVAGEAGFEQLQSQLTAMLARETHPKYQPLEKKYLLGLVRMPDGRWMFTSLRKALSKPTYGF